MRDGQSGLRAAVIERLDYLDLLAGEGDEPSRAALAGTEIVRLTDALRALIEVQALDERGRCPQCSARRHPRRRSCTVWATAHQHLLAAGTRGEPGRPPAVTSADVRR